MTLRMVARSAAACCSLLAGGCVLVGVQAPALNDLRIEEAVVGPDWRRNPSRHDGMPHALLHITVSTRVELTDYRRRFNNSIGIRSAPCLIGDARSAAFEVIRDMDGGFVDDTAANGILLPARPPDSDGSRRYMLTFRIAAPEREATALDGREGTIQAHDLRAQPYDLCFRVEGGDMMFAHRSRTYRIPYAMIAQALARAGLPHAPVPQAAATAPLAP